ncbi:MAG: type II toxin-antitoxin system HicB family antitoxin [Oscillospiraceae bacterium]|jgi:predicted HicB family RNase H-like nuclease|nr:type II toxin-antitoxin system HicB family antitoxin [Oscillospiraceae bacterium]
MDKNKFEEKLKAIPVQASDDFDEKMLAGIEPESDNLITMERLEAEIEYSGKLSLRVPKSLHKTLIESAKKEGVSLNQYALYKLSQ